MNVPNADAPIPALPMPPDVEMLGLDVDPGGRTMRFELIPPLARVDGALYGGTGIAVSVVAMEAATDREALWVTTQYVSTTHLGSVIEVTADVLASGRAISQVQVTGRHRGEVLFVSLGSTATPRAGGMTGQYVTMPSVSGPDDSSPIPIAPDPAAEAPILEDHREYRAATVEDPRLGPPMAVWARLREGRPLTRAAIAFLADMVPPAIARSAGSTGGGPSLDNSLRFGHVEDGLDWVLLELRGHLAYGAHAHGSVTVWAPDGTLLAVGGQSANMMLGIRRLSG